MIIQKTRIRKLPKELDRLPKNKVVRVGISIENVSRDDLRKVGFAVETAVGETILPDPDIGSVSRFNAEGKYLVHKDREKETAYRQIEWSWKQWRGRYDYEERTEIRDVPYLRYPRTFFSPPSVEMSVTTDVRGNLVLVTPECKIGEGDELVHQINLFLEAFGMCQVFLDDLSALVLARQVKLNWTVLPPGKTPWENLKPSLKEMVSRAQGKTQAVIEHRLEEINAYEPDFVAVGKAGFSGYVIFGFEELELYVMESIYLGNATYIFESQWEKLSQLTKAEILDQSLHFARIIHRQGWESEIRSLLRTRRSDVA